MKLLSIDGGGIKGLYSATALAKMEERYNVKIDAHVDVIAGTSIGGIIALGLAAGKRPHEVVEFFREYGPQIFPPSWFRSIFGKLTSLIRPRYGSSVLRNACKKFFGEELRLRDLVGQQAGNSKRPSVCIPTVNLGTGKVKVFKTPHHKALYQDKNYCIWQIALATSAAPYFFPIFRMPSSKDEQNLGFKEYYVDGGLWGNNPSMVALTEAMTYIQDENHSEKAGLDNIELLSVGNVPSSHGDAALNGVSRGLLHWRERLVIMPLNCQSEAAENMTNLLLTHNKGRYLRIANDGNLNSEQRVLIGLDKANTASLTLLQQLAHDDISRITAHGQHGDQWLRSFFDLEEG